MKDKDLFEVMLDFGDSWKVTKILINEKEQEIEINVEYIGKTGKYPDTNEECPIYDKREERRWRHLDTLQYKTYINCSIPRVKNKKGEVATIKVPWAENLERHTYLFEEKVIGILLASKNQTKTAELLRVSSDVVNRIMHISCERGLAKRDKGEKICYLSLDEKSFQKGHKYITVLSNPENKSIIDVAIGRTKETTGKLIEETLTKKQREGVKAVSMDMWEAYMNVVKEIMPKASIVHDKFHLIKYLNEGIDKTRKREVKNQEVLKRSKYVMLKNTENLTEKQKAKFDEINSLNFFTSQAWRIKENFKSLFSYTSLREGKKYFNQWIRNVNESTIKPMIKVAEMFKNHSKGILNYIRYRITNAMAERLNGKIQETKFVAKGYRKFPNFRIAILFFYGKLDLFPQKSQ